MTAASATTVEYRCPGEKYAITRSVHLARLASFYPACRNCVHCHDTGMLSLPEVNPDELSSPLTEFDDRSRLFRPEGVRGIYLNELTRSNAGEIAGAFASWLWDEASRLHERDAKRDPAPLRLGPTVVLGHDERPSSPDIVTGVGAALRRMGCQVIDVGLSTRPCFWFAVNHLQAAGGVHVSGTGCDPAWTGLDFVGRSVQPCSRGAALDEIQARFTRGYSRPSRRPGSQRLFQAWVPYEASFLKHFHALRPFQIAFACPNRLVRDLMGRIARKMACRLQPVETPTRERNLFDPDDPDVKRTAQATRDLHAHFGVLVNDDGQQCLFFDETGRTLPSQEVSRLIADIVQTENPGSPIVLESSAESNEFLPRTNRQCIDGGTTLSSMSQALHASQAAFGGGDSGRNWFLEGFHTSDAVLTLARLMQALSRSDTPFSEVLASRKTGG